MSKIGLTGLLFGLLAALLIAFGCSEQKDDNLAPNILPETHIFLHLADPETDRPDTTVSRQELFWYGNDPDGWIVGYYYHWDYFGDMNNRDNWVWTVDENNTFYVPLQAESGTFTFRIQAVDNNAVFDGEPANDNPPISTDGAIDTSPARLSVPIRNSPPIIDFVLSSNPQDDEADTTFTTRTFFWTASDLDGDQTITNFRWALDDTTDWNELPGDARNLTIEDIEPGLHTFYIQAVDIASAVSKTLMYPDTTDGENGTWYVKQPRGPVLLVDDDADITGQDLPFYFDALNSVPSLQSNFSLWTVKDRLPYFQDDIEATLNFFEAVIWYSDRTPSIPEAGPALTAYVNAGNKLFLSTPQCFDEGDTLFAFLPVDSLYRQDLLRIPPGTEIDSLLSDYPSLLTGSRIISYADSPAPSAGAESIFLLPANDNPNWGWPDDLPFGVRYPMGGPAQIIYFPAPLHLVNGNENGVEFLKIVLQSDFGF